MLTDALNKAYLNDHDLFIRCGLEQACVFRIGYYLQELINNNDEYTEFRQYNLDCEYNKNGNNTKETPRFRKGTRPDLILHRRMNNDYNLLMVEFKGYWLKNLNNDYQKLEDFTHPNGKYKYKLGAHVKLKEDSYDITYFIDGQKYLLEEPLVAS